MVFKKDPTRSVHVGVADGRSIIEMCGRKLKTVCHPDKLQNLIETLFDAGIATVEDIRFSSLLTMHIEKLV